MTQQPFIERRKSPPHNQQLSITINNLPIGVILFDPTGKVLFSNMQGANYLGYTSIEELMAEKDLDAMRKCLFENFIVENEHGEPYTGEKSPVVLAIKDKKPNEYVAHLISKKTGRESWAVARANPILSDEGELTMVVYSLTDITEQKLLQQRNDSFVSMASHELKTPVTTIKMLIQILQEQYKNSEDVTLREYFLTIGQQVDQLTKLVTDLLDVSKIKADKFTLEQEVIDFDALVRGTVKDCQLLSPQHTLSVEGETHMHVFGDATNITRIFINLITNAIKYSPRGGKIIAHLSHTAHEVRLGIEDSGIGIAKENQENIFERFYQVGNVKGQSFSGLGIGLYISASIATQHSGRIWVESGGVGLGSTFFLALPIHTPTNETKEKNI